jgi:hypothetical protein
MQHLVEGVYRHIALRQQANGLCCVARQQRKPTIRKNKKKKKKRWAVNLGIRKKGRANQTTTMRLIQAKKKKNTPQTRCKAAPRLWFRSSRIFWVSFNPPLACSQVVRKQQTITWLRSDPPPPKKKNRDTNVFFFALQAFAAKRFFSNRARRLASSVLCAAGGLKLLLAYETKSH